MFTKSDIQTLRSQGTTDRQIMEMTAKVIPSAYKALQGMDADKTTPEAKKTQILKEMVDRNAGNGISMLPYIASLMSNNATKTHDNLQETYKNEEKKFSLIDTAKLTAKRVVGGLASVPEALLYPVVQGARAADYLAGKAAEPFTGKQYGDLVPQEKVEEVRQQSWNAAPTALSVLTGAAGIAAGLTLPAISTKTAFASAAASGLSTLETGGTVKNAAMNALINGISTKALMSFNPVASAATAVATDMASRYTSGQSMDSPDAAESYLSSALLGAISGKANKVGVKTSKVYQQNKTNIAPKIGDTLQTVAQRIYQSALKPTKAILDKYPDVVKTGLEEKIPVTREAIDRVGSSIDALNAEIGRQIESGKSKGQVVLSSNVVKAMADTVSFYQDTIGGKQSVKELQQLAKQFAKEEGVSIPVDRAQRLKVNTYQVLRKAYGELKGVEIEGRKAIARGLKEELVSAIPELKTLNARESQLIGLEQALERFTGRYSNKDLIDLTSGIGGAVGAAVDGGGGLLKGFALTKLAKMAVDHPSINSRLAILLNELGKKLSPVLAPEDVPAGMEIVNLQGSSQGLQPPQQVKSKTSQSTIPEVPSTVNTSKAGASVKKEMTPKKASKAINDFPSLTPEEVSKLTPEEKSTGLIGGSDSTANIRDSFAIDKEARNLTMDAKFELMAALKKAKLMDKDGNIIKGVTQEQINAIKNPIQERVQTRLDELTAEKVANLQRISGSDSVGGGQTLYHGTPNKLEGDFLRPNNPTERWSDFGRDPSWKKDIVPSVSLAENESYAKAFADSSSGQGGIYKVANPPKRILDLTSDSADARGYWKSNIVKDRQGVKNDLLSKWLTTKNGKKYLDSKGYDAIRIDMPNDIGGGGIEVRVFNDTKVSPLPVSDSATKSTAISKDLQPLLNEAKKYKSAEEFVKDINKRAMGAHVSKSSPLRFSTVKPELILKDNIDLPFGEKGFAVRYGDLIQIVEKKTGRFMGKGSTLLSNDSSALKKAIANAKSNMETLGENGVKKGIKNSLESPDGKSIYWNKIPDERLSEIWNQAHSQ